MLQARANQAARETAGSQPTQNPDQRTEEHFGLIEPPVLRMSGSCCAATVAEAHLRCSLLIFAMQAENVAAADANQVNLLQLNASNVFHIGKQLLANSVETNQLLRGVLRAVRALPSGSLGTGQVAAASAESVCSQAAGTAGTSDIPDGV